MKKLSLSFITLVLLSLPFASYASNDMYNMSIKSAMDNMPADVKTKIGNTKFYFGKDSKPMFASERGIIETSNKTRAIFRGAETACNRAFYNALIALKHKSMIDGKGDVANIQSNWNRIPTSSTETFVCAKGFLMSGVALKGDAIN